jgi:hypothetical protein
MVLRDDRVLHLKRRGEAVGRSTLIESVDSKAGRERVRTLLEPRPFPHSEPAAGRPGFAVEIEQDGKRTVGRFIRRKFHPAGRK